MTHRIFFKSSIPPELIETCMEYGAMYTWAAATDSREIANTGWHVPTLTELQTLADYLGASGDYTTTNTVGGELKETGLTYWTSPNTAATNSTKFSARGSGGRSDDDGDFGTLGGFFLMWTASELNSTNAHFGQIAYNNDYFLCLVNTSRDKGEGLAVRLVKDTTTLSHGETSTYIGNNGYEYNTVCIGTQEWTVENLAETYFRNGDTIPYVSADADWANLADTAPALSVFNNTSSNAGCSFPIPTVQETFIYDGSGSNYALDSHDSTYQRNYAQAFTHTGYINRVNFYAGNVGGADFDIRAKIYNRNMDTVYWADKDNYLIATSNDVIDISLYGTFPTEFHSVTFDDILLDGTYTVVFEYENITANNASQFARFHASVGNITPLPAMYVSNTFRFYDWTDRDLAMSLEYV